MGNVNKKEKENQSLMSSNNHAAVSYYGASSSSNRNDNTPMVVKCKNRDGRVTAYKVIQDSPSTSYTAVSLIVSTLLAGGSVVLFYDSNKDDLFRMIAGVVMNFFPNIYFGKSSFDEIKDLGKPSKQHMGFRVFQVAGGIVLGVVATAPGCIAEYKESASILFTTLQAFGLPMNFVGMLGALKQLSSPLARFFSQKAERADLTDEEKLQMPDIRKALLMNLLLADPAIRAGKFKVPYQGSLATKIYFVLQAIQEGKDLNRGLYYGHKITHVLLGLVFAALLAVGTLGYTASSRDFFEILGWTLVASWFAGTGVMIPQYYFSIDGGISAAKTIADTIFLGIATGKFPVPLEISLRNPLLISVLAQAVILTGSLGWASGATGRTLFDKYFPFFLGKEALSSLIEVSVVGFNMYYFLIVAALAGVGAAYLHYGSQEKRAIAHSHNNYRNLVMDLEGLSESELAYALRDLANIAKANVGSSSTDDARDVVDVNLESSVSTTPQQASAVQDLSAAVSTITKAVGPSFAQSLRSRGFFSKSQEMPANTEHQSKLKTYWSSQKATLDQDPEASHAESSSLLAKPSKRCSCTIV